MGNLKQDFRYVAEEDVYICPAGERLASFSGLFTRVEIGHIVIGSDGCGEEVARVRLETKPAVVATRFKDRGNVR